MNDDSIVARTSHPREIANFDVGVFKTTKEVYIEISNSPREYLFMLIEAKKLRDKIDSAIRRLEEI